MNTTKANIVAKISKSTGISKIDTKAVIDGAIQSIIEAVAEGNRVELRGFGVFYSKKRKPRQARNPKTGAIVELNERFVPLFKPSIDFTKRTDEALSQSK